MEKQTETQTELWQYVERHKPAIEKSLRAFLPLAPRKIESRFNEAVEYALLPGGKRLRPVLTLLGAELFGGKPETVIPAAAATEYIHTSSLIFDDLPCMDNANRRRGKASLHEKFGEGLAILVAIGFLNTSYGLVFVNHAGRPELAMQAHAEIVECVGAAGMIGGQAVDLALAKNGGGRATAQYEAVRNLKTSALMRLSLRIGAILAGASYLDLPVISRFAERLGDAYQLSDDLLDLEEDSEKLNLRENSPAGGEQNGAVSLRLEKNIEEAKLLLVDNFPPSEARSCLIQLADYLAVRQT